MFRGNYLDISRITKDNNVLKIFKIVRQHGGVVRFVGGAVRDALVGINASNLDLSTDLSPDELAEACEDAGIRTVPIGLKIDTLGVVLGNNLLEISSLRKQNKDRKNREVEFTDNWEEDASRRDLTINAVYADESGNVFDYYNGIEDLEKGVVRFIGEPEAQIKEDYSRILRFFRFYSLFGKAPIDAKSLKACKNNLTGLKALPVERIRDEFIKILLTPKAAETLKIMFENNILSNWLPDSPYLEDLQKLANLEKKYAFMPDAVRRFAALYRPDKILAENIATRMKSTKHQKEALLKLVSENCSIEDLQDPLKQKQYIYRYGKDFCLSKLLLEEAHNRGEEKISTALIAQIQAATVPVFPLTGKDIIKHGISGNAKIGAAREYLEQVWFESGFELNRDELLAKIKP